MKHSLISFFAIFFIFAGLSCRSACAEEAWKKEFDGICINTENAMSLTVDELKTLMARCDKLKPQIEALDESAKKVYLRRLKMCFDLFSYVLDTKLKAP